MVGVRTYVTCVKEDRTQQTAGSSVDVVIAHTYDSYRYRGWGCAAALRFRRLMTSLSSLVFSLPGAASLPSVLGDGRPAPSRQRSFGGGSGACAGWLVLHTGARIPRHVRTRVLNTRYIL